jgi:hypothetical protein
MVQIETPPCCLKINVTQNSNEKISKTNVSFMGGAGGSPGCLKISVTENGDRLWSMTYQGGDVMNHQDKQNMLELCAQHYKNELKTKSERTDFLDKLMPLFGYQKRKSLIRALSQIRKEKTVSKRGRKLTYNDFHVLVLKQVWTAMNNACGKRIKAALPNWLIHHKKCSDEVKARLLKMGAATIDRILEPARAELRRFNNTGTKKGRGHTRNLIQLRDPSKQADAPGYFETDTVAHCGDYIWGTFAWTVSFTDLFSGWTEAKMILGKDAEKTVKAILEIENSSLIAWLALYFDNGSEFINKEMVEAFKILKEGKIKIERGRSGKKNDQAHIEQKNGHCIRKLLGYDRIEPQNVVDMINDLYGTEWRLLYNYYYPQMKLVEKDRAGSKVKRKFDNPLTPYQRLMNSGAVTDEIKAKLKAEYETLDPFELHERVQKKLTNIAIALKAYENKKNKEVA